MNHDDCDSDYSQINYTADYHKNLTCVICFEWQLSL